MVVNKEETSPFVVDISSFCNMSETEMSLIRLCLSTKHKKKALFDEREANTIFLNNHILLLYLPWTIDFVFIRFHRHTPTHTKYKRRVSHSDKVKYRDIKCVH